MTQDLPPTEEQLRHFVDAAEQTIQPVPTSPAEKHITVNLEQFRQHWQTLPHAGTAYTKGSLCSKYLKGTDPRSLFHGLNKLFHESVKDAMLKVNGDCADIKPLLEIHTQVYNLITEQILKNVRKEELASDNQKIVHTLTAAYHGFLNTIINDHHTKE